MWAYVKHASTKVFFYIDRSELTFRRMFVSMFAVFLRLLDGGDDVWVFC